MKKTILLTTIALITPSVLADTDMMGDYGMMSGNMGWMMGGAYSLIYFVIISFLFSIIFWWTYKWIVKGKKR